MTDASSTPSDGYIQFSAAEMQRREQLVRAALDEAGLDAFVVFGWSASGRAVQADVHYLSGFLGMRDNYVLVPRGGDPILFAQSYNHVPNAADVSRLADVRWGGPNSGATVGAELHARGLTRVGVVGMMPYQHHAAMAEAAPGATFTDATRTFRLLRTTKSDEEIEWLRRGAAYTDLALANLREHLRPGLHEWELAPILEQGYRAQGGMTYFHYVASTPMADPQRCVPAQVQSERVLEVGDVVTVESTAAYHGYGGQLLRTLVVGTEPNDLFADLHRCAEDVFDALATTIRTGATTDDVLDVADQIADSGYTIRDALVHGFGIGLLPPSIGTRETPHDNTPWTFAANQTVVVQPNVVTRDETAGVQTGELCLVTDDGLESLHTFPRELVRT